MANSNIKWEDDERKIMSAPISVGESETKEIISLKDIFKKDKKDCDDFSFWKNNKPYSKKYRPESLLYNDDEEEYMSFWDKNINIHNYDEDNEEKNDIKVSISSFKQEDLEKNHDLYNSLTFYIEKK